MLSNIVGLVLSWLLRWVGDSIEEWHQLELRDRRNRQLIKDAVKEAVDAARIRNEEISDNPEPIGASIDRLRDFAKRRAVIVGGESDGTLFERGLNARREKETGGIDSDDDAEVSPADDGSIGRDSEG